MTNESNNQKQKISDNKIIVAMIENDLIQKKNLPREGRTLFQHRETGVFWEKYYPFPECHGDGPPELRLVSQEYVKGKYGIEI